MAFLLQVGSLECASSIRRGKDFVQCLHLVKNPWTSTRLQLMMPREISQVRFQVETQEFGLCMDTPAQPTVELAGRFRHGDTPCSSARPASAPGETSRGSVL